VIGLIAYYTLMPLIVTNAGEPVSPTSPTSPTSAAYGLLPVAILSLLLLSAQAVTAITSERDKGALDLLLVTDLTPKEFIFGKLLGIAYNSMAYLVPPLFFVAVYACYSLLATPPQGHDELRFDRNMRAFISVVVAWLVLAAFVMVLGLHIGLRTDKSRLAVIHTLATVFFLSVGTLICIGLIVVSRRFDVQWTSFVLFVVAGIGGMWWVLNGERPSAALKIASGACPLAVLYCVMNVLIGKPGSEESSDPILPAVVIALAFGFAIAAMLVPLLSEFDVALGRTTAHNE
jgi:ABC-type Na+ efflux pump permease subunit